jgi:hypothetical protein
MSANMMVASRRLVSWPDMDKTRLLPFVEAREPIRIPPADHAAGIAARSAA